MELLYGGGEALKLEPPHVELGSFQTGRHVVLIPHLVRCVPVPLALSYHLFVEGFVRGIVEDEGDRLVVGPLGGFDHVFQNFLFHRGAEGFRDGVRGESPLLVILGVGVTQS